MSWLGALGNAMRERADKTLEERKKEEQQQQMQQALTQLLVGAPKFEPQTTMGPKQTPLQGGGQINWNTQQRQGATPTFPNAMMDPSRAQAYAQLGAQNPNIAAGLISSTLSQKGGETLGVPAAIWNKLTPEQQNAAIEKKLGIGGGGGMLEGTGVDQQFYNILLGGDPSSKAYAAAYARMAEPKITIDQQGNKTVIQPDMSWTPKPSYNGSMSPQVRASIDGANRAGKPAPVGAVETSQLPTPAEAEVAAAAGQELTDRSPETETETIGGSTVTTTRKPKQVSGEVAGRVSGAQQSIKSIPEVKDIIFRNKGQIDRELLGELQLALSGYAPLTLMSDDAKKLYTRFFEMTDARLRIMTGAAAPEAEVLANMRAFAPTISDSDEVINDKLSRLDGFFREFLNGQGQPIPEIAPDPTFGTEDMGGGTKKRLKWNPKTGELE